MKMRAWAIPVFFLAFTFTIQATAQGKGRGHQPGGVESTMNLSYPAAFSETPLQTGDIGTYTLSAVYPNGMSYGCLIPETIGTTEYTNTSCVNSDGVPLSRADCVTKCGDVPVERIYWQKNSSNKWQAGYSSPSSVPSISTPLQVTYIDWGDNLESKTWPVQVLRVETNTYSTLPGYVEGTDIANNPGVRFDMWHVSGQGTNELWGVHTTDPQDSTDPVPYVVKDEAGNDYWPFVVDVSSMARLNIAKLETAAGSCPTTATGSDQSPYASSLTWNATSHLWSGAVYTNDMLYTAELNIKGSYVYGYNWDLRSENVPSTVNKAGWWRLTFYTFDPTNAANPPISFSTWETTSAENYDALAAPPNPPTVGEIAPFAETGLLMYVPQVDKTNNLTYIDLCIAAAGSSGRGGGRRR